MSGPELLTRHIATIEATVEPPLSFGDWGAGTRRCVPIAGGRVHGAIEGRILPGGADWQVLLPDGTVDLEARYGIETDDGATIEVLSKGVRSAPPEVMARLNAGEQVPSDLYYFRTAMRFWTAAERYLPLARRIHVGVAEREPALVRIRVYEIG